MGFFCPNHIKFRLKSSQDSSLITVTSGAKFKERLTCGFICDLKNLVSFNSTTQEHEHFTLMGSFCPKYMRFELKIYRGVIYHDTEQWCKIWINPDPKVSKIAWGIGWTFIRTVKTLKSCTLIGCFCVMRLKGDVKFKGKSTRGLKNGISNLVNFHASSQKSQNLPFDGLLLSNECKVLDGEVQKSYVSWHWRVMQFLKNNWLLVPKMR